MFHGRNSTFIKPFDKTNIFFFTKLAWVLMEIRVHVVNVSLFQDQHVSMKRSYSMLLGPQIPLSFGKVKMASTCAILPMESGVVAHISLLRHPTAILDISIITQKEKYFNSF